MANLFAGVNGQPGPFSDVNTDVARAEAPTGSLAQFRQAQVAAMANVNPESDQIFEEFKQLQDQYVQDIQTFGEHKVRTEVAGRRQQRQMQALQALAQESRETDPTGELQRGAQLALQQEIAADNERRAEAALEKEAVDRIMDVAARDPDQARVLLNLMEFGSPVEQIRDMNTKYMILQREIDRAQIAVGNQGWVRHAADFLLSAVPLKGSMGLTGNVDIDREYKNWFANLTSQVLPGRRLRSEAASLWNMAPEDFAPYVRDVLLPRVKANSDLLGYTSRSQQLDILANMKETRDPLLTNMFALVDNVGLLSVKPVSAALRGSVSLPAMALRLGGRKTSGMAMAQAAAELAKEGTTEAVVKAGMGSIDEVVDGLSTTSMRATGTPFVVTPQAVANDILDKARGIRDKLPDWLQPGRYANEEEFGRALNDFIESESKRFDNRIVDVADRQVKLADGSRTTTVDFTLGRKDATGFTRESSARNFANDLGFGDSQIIQAEDGTYFVKVSRVMPETGTYTNLLKVQTSGPLKRFLSGARERSDIMLANLATRSDMTRNRVLNNVVRELSKDMRVDPASRERIGQLWAAGDNQGKWWSIDEANMLYQRTFGRDISEREWKAYSALRRMNDVEYVIRNDTMWKEKALRGYETVDIDLGPGGSVNRSNAIIDEDFSKGIRGRAVNASDGTIYDRALTPEEVKWFKENGYISVHLDEPHKFLVDNSEVHTVFVPKTNVQRFQLERQQLPYRAGGHRIYTDKYFAKQTNWGVQPDGTRYLKSPHTFMVGTKAQVDEWVQTMDRMRLAVKNDPGISPGALDDIVDGRAGYPSGQEFLDGVKAGNYDVDEAFGSFFDREMPTPYHSGASLFVGDELEDGFTQYARTHGRLYYSKKSTTGLVDWRGEQAPTLDAWQSTNRAFLNIANLSSFSDYKISSVDRWFNTFKDYLEPNATYKTPMQFFMNAKPNSLAKQHNVLDALEDQRTIIRRNLGWQTDGDLRVQEFQRRFSEWAMGTDPSSIRHGASRAVLNFMEDKNPIGFLRGWAFDLKLGLFNPVQLFLQANTYFAMLAIDPGGALKGIQAGMALRPYLAFKGDKTKLLEQFAKNPSALGFDSAEELKAFFTHAEKSGFFDINETHTLINSLGPKSVFNVTGSKLDEFRQAGRFFFNEGETFNRLVAYRSAWNKMSKEMDFTKVREDDFLNAVAGRAEDLALGMSRSSQAWWQQGLASLPTQFFAYQARMLEAMLGAFTGKGRFTREESWKLIVGQAFMYGAAGIPLAPVVSDFIKGKAGETPDLNTPLGWIDRGFMDNMWFNLTNGSDMMLSDRLGTGGWLGDTVSNLFGMNRYGEVSPMDVLGGATWSISKDVMEDIGPVLKYMSAESGADQGHPMTERAFRNLASNISSVSNIMKFHTIQNYGYLKSGSGNIQVGDLPPASAWAVLLWGAQPGATDDMSAISASNESRTKLVDEASKVITQYRQEMLQHPDRTEELSEEINLFVNLLDPDIRRSALAKAHSDVEPSLYEAYAKRRERQRQQQAFMENIE